MENLLEHLFKIFNLTEEDVLITALFAVAGFSVDAVFFPAGLPPVHVAAIVGSLGMLVSRWGRTRRFFIEYSLRKVERLVAQQRLTHEQGEYYKRQIIEKWLESTTGIPPQEAVKQLPPKSEP